MFCSNCGNEANGNFCSNCGSPLNGCAPVAVPQAQSPVVAEDPTEEVVLYECQPQGLVDKAKAQANVNSTKYCITNQRVLLESGLLGKRQEEIDLSKIKDFQVKQSLTEKLQGIGSVVIISIDPSTPKLVLENVEKPFEVKDIIRSAMLKYKKLLNITYRENI